MNKLVVGLIIITFVLAAALAKVPMSPKYDLVTTDRNISFEVFGISDKIEVDDNANFVSPIVLDKPFVNDLDPGIYYWKADNSFLIGKFTIASEVNVALEKLEEKYRVSNLGNTEVDLDIRDGLLTGAAVLGLNEKLNLDLENNSVVIASQK